MPKPQQTTVTKETGHGTVSLTRTKRITYRGRKRLAERRRIKQSVAKFRRFLLKNYAVMTSSMLFGTYDDQRNTVFGDPSIHPPFLRGHIGYGITGGEQHLDSSTGRYNNELINTFLTPGNTNYQDGFRVGNEIFFAIRWWKIPPNKSY